MRHDLETTRLLRCLAIVLLAAPPLAAQVDVLTRHNDNARLGANLAETRLNPSTVNKDHFGKLAYRVVDGNVYAQPLVASQARIDGRSGATNALIVATEHNSVYAFDAEDVVQTSTKAELWHTGSEVLGEPVDSRALAKAIGAPGCVDLTTEMGITSTPAIQMTSEDAPREGLVYVVAQTKKVHRYEYRLFVLSLATGKKVGESTIDGSVPGSGVGAAAGRIHFHAMYELNRPALLLDRGVLYIAFGAHCDHGPYHGWLFAYDVSNPKAPRMLDAFCSTPNGKGTGQEGRAGIWMSGEGPASDHAGNIYFVTGDGSYRPPTDFGDSVMKVKLSGSGIQVDDWYTPDNQETLKNQDGDLGSGGVVVLPQSHLLLAGGKEGRLYLIDRDRMGKGTRPPLDSIQVTHGPDRTGKLYLYYNIHGTPVIWPRAGEIFVYLNGEEDPVKQYRLIPDTGPEGNGWKLASDRPFKTSEDCPTRPKCVTAPYPNFPAGVFGQPGRETTQMPGGILSLSADGATEGSGILWVTMPSSQNANHGVVEGVLRALDASDVSKPELWNSENTGNENDRLGQFAKFSPPTIANGKVYVSTFQQETIGNDGIHRKTKGGDQPGVAIYGLR